jgi:cation diffusion facilitator family transporter
LNIERWGWYSILANILLGGINLIVARASGSLAVEAELIHNLVDLLSAVAVLVGLKLAMRRSRAFPYGLFKIENVIAVGLALMVFLTAYEVARHALLEPARVAQVSFWMLAGMVLAAAIPLIFSHYELRVGQASNSPALMANAREYRVHVFTSGAALAALVSQWIGMPIDRLAAILIVVAIAKTGWDLLSDSMRVLLDASLDAEMLQRIRQIILADPQVAELQWVTGHNAGRYRFVEVSVVLRTADLERAESTMLRIEQRIREAIPYIERVLIHPEPLKREFVRYAAPLSDAEGTLSEHLGEAPFFALVAVRVRDRSTAMQQIMPNPHREVQTGKGIRVAEWLVEQKVDVVLVKESLHGKGPAYVFTNAGAQMRITDAASLGEFLSKLGEISPWPEL